MVTLPASDSFDWIRTLRMAGYGTLIAGPSLHVWFNFASRIIPKRDVISTLKKIFIGQTCFGPIMTSIFFSLNAGLQGKILIVFFSILLVTCSRIGYDAICDCANPCVEV